MDLKEFRKRGCELIDFIADYHENIRSRRVTPSSQPGYLRDRIPADPPEDPEEWDDILENFKDIILPGMMNTLHPRFHAYAGRTNSYPSMLGQLLTDAMACNTFTWAASPACTELEMVVVNWLGKMLDLPEKFLFQKGGSKGGGVLQHSAGSCAFVTMIAARFTALKSLKRETPTATKNELLSSLVVYCSQEAHSSVEKSALLCLVKLRIVAADSSHRMRGPALRDAIQADIEAGHHPFFVCATVGTPTCGSCDDLSEIGAVCEEFDLWLHVDAAYAGNAAICPEFRDLLQGIELASSLCVSPSKWLMVNGDSTALWVTNVSSFTEALIVLPAYLEHDADHQATDYRHWSVPLTRSFRALKLWYTIRSYGVERLRKNIRNQIELAKVFERHVQNDSRFEVKNEVLFGFVCFRLKGSDVLSRNLLSSVNKSGKLFMVATTVQERYVLRFSVCNVIDSEEEINGAWEIITKHADEILKSI